MRQPDTGVRRDIEPAEVRAWQEQLLVRVGAERLVIVQAKVGVGRAKPEVADRGFALVKNRRRAESLSKAGHANLRQPLDGLVKVIDPRLGEQADAEVAPMLRDLDVRRRLRVAAELALEKVAVHERVALILQHELGREVGPDVDRVIKAEPMPVVAVGEVGAAGEAARAGGGIAVVEQVNRRLAAAGLAKVVARVEADSPAPARAVVEVRLAAQPVAQVPVIRALEKQAEAAAVTGREAPLVRGPVEPVAVVRKIKHRDFSGVKRCATGLDVFAGDDAQVAGAEAQHRVGAVVGGQPNVVGRVAVARGVALDVAALDEKRRLPRAKIVGLHRAGLKVVKQAVGGDDAILVLQRDAALGEDLAGGLVEAASVGDDVGALALLLERDAETVVQDDQPLVEVVVELARLERLDLPHRLVR